ncbi:aminodeoxychorismate synthase, component I [Erwinia sp. OLTSP20]|uniref:aminodeoxychorismate synthase component 1 n=1 Tax=unclassified Erwinia TaxID=2622719 RepID=UPI000C1881C7|nr:MULTISPECIES: aminodeoxychorismate synthase component 1 [unclassified Erwinia]PIJ51422.1 aminodeoxychorismate synthase component I [Erwinia sp. OAMSP11]PIJ73444.1 aminodeoxychorismate synthase, component I [Erwinia sp. OLSSP12]PIJ85507.1 aminodeoxychorismate synthase, component I [Erwinia sp. OLCASP19]PIJ85905.1 aminodeoxychorismate synthase, component I [Erwinia sp. OLMTSP26]PIJ87386.1 aminodeoxychorismate synthase, component I [Erwinia sp. OLMDSP33]
MKYHSLTYQRDALKRMFASIAARHWSMLLHSGDAVHPDSRFDILVADPLATLETAGKHTRITESGKVQLSEQDPLSLCKILLRRLLPETESDDTLPFLGGAVGLFGYDLGRRFERLPQRAQPDLQTPDMAIGIYDWAIIADHQQQRLTLVCHGDLQHRLIWLAGLADADDIQPFALTSGWQSSLSREAYARCFAQIQHWIVSGDCYQVNLAQRFTAGYRGSLWQAFEHLLAANQAPFSAWLTLPAGQILSFSPERFLRLRSGLIQTRPIKGTLPRLADPQADQQQAQRLASSEKDRAENLMIVDLLRNDIGRVAQPGSVSVPSLFAVEAFPAVYHLVSTITARLRPELHASDLLRACFPGGSITGAPKVRAMEIIEQLEPQRRNAWCGSIGYFSACGAMDSSITIRTLIAENQQLYCAAGGGIVADSQLDAEYQETFDKVSRILSTLDNLTQCHDE